MVPKIEGLFVEPACAAPLAGLLRKGRQGLIPKGSLVTVTLTGHGLKDPDTAMDQNKIEAQVVEPHVDAILAALAG
jgi:threonine synthase